MPMNRFFRSAAVVSLAAAIGSGCADLRRPDDRADLAGGQSGMDLGVLDGLTGKDFASVPDFVTAPDLAVVDLSLERDLASPLPPDLSMINGGPADMPAFCTLGHSVFPCFLR